MPAFKSQFSDAGFVQFDQSFIDHSVVLLFGGGGERKIETLGFPELQADAGIFGGVRCRKETGMFPVLHVFPVGLKDAGIGARLGKTSRSMARSRPRALP